MPRVNVYLPADLHTRAKRAKLNLSVLCQNAIEHELARRARRRALARYADQLEEQFGPATPAEIADASAWVESVQLAVERASSRRGEQRPRRARRAG